jgi:MoaA/NifB/PqqE/SkfB family radical SAM enzyme
MLSLLEIQQIQIELTTRCNARCPMCMRNYRGFDHNGGYPETELSLSDIQKILSQVDLTHIREVRFNGNLGDFGLASDGQAIVHWLLDQGVGVYISTNGSMRTPSWWAKLARPGVVIGFALDGLADTHSLYRQDTDWHTVIKNATAFIQAGGTAIWRFIPFDHNRHQEQQCQQLARELGFARFENINDGRDNGPVYTRVGDFSHWLGEPWNNTDVEPDIISMVQSHITWFDASTVKSSKDITPLDIGCNHKRSRELYITANGEVYPCCYLGYYPKTMQHPGNEQIKLLVQENNALEYPLEDCIKWFDQVEKTWDQPSIAEGRLYTCVNTCGSWKPPVNKQIIWHNE